MCVSLGTWASRSPAPLLGCSAATQTGVQRTHVQTLWVHLTFKEPNWVFSLSSHPTLPNGGWSSGLRNNTVFVVFHLIITSGRPVALPAGLYPEPVWSQHKAWGHHPETVASSQSGLALLTDSFHLRTYTCVCLRRSVLNSTDLEPTARAGTTVWCWSRRFLPPAYFRELLGWVRELMCLFICWSCHNKIPQTAWFKQQTLTFSQSWR